MSKRIVPFTPDGGGNHIAAIRAQAVRPQLRLDFSSKMCTGCFKRKPRKGGDNPSKRDWKCADCKAAK